MSSVANGKQYWRSLDDLADSPELQEIVQNEFPSRLDAIVDPLSRRRFVQLMGASFALAGLTGCDLIRWPKEKILPFAHRPEDRDPGTPVYYATAMELGGVGQGLLVRSYDGRPIKVEGNEKHPDTLGASDSYAQASVLGLYDPDRSQDVFKKNAETASSWEEFVQGTKDLFDTIRQNRGRQLSILVQSTSSPTVAWLRERMASEEALPKIHWYEWEAVNRDNALEGAELVFGEPRRTHLKLGGEKPAEVILSLDADLFGDHPAATRYAREFSGAREPLDSSRDMNRLYCVESTFSITGGMADERVPMRAANIERFALALGAELLNHDGVKVDASLAEKLMAYGLPKEHADKPLIQRIANDLAKKRSVIAVGRRQPATLHALGHLLNDALGNVGVTVNYTTEKRPGSDGKQPARDKGIVELIEELNAKDKVKTLVILGGNPVLDAPVDKAFLQAIQKPEGELTTIHLGLYRDETAQACNWHVPQAHYLESWGDTAGWDGTQSLVQPLIQPFYGGKTAIEMLALILGITDAVASHPYTLVREAHRAAHKGADFEGHWRSSLHEGVVANTAFPIIARNRLQFSSAGLIEKLAGISTEPAKAEGYEIVFTTDHKVYDGRYANNAWLQELPDPLTKITWDNAALISPATATKLAVKQDDVVTIKVGDKHSVDAPVFVLPGLPDDSVSLSLGYGRGPEAGMVGDGPGVNAYQLRTSAGMGFAPCTVTKTGATYALATTQDHSILDLKILNDERLRRSGELVREATNSHYRENARFAKDVWDGGPAADVQFGLGPDPDTTMLWKEPQDFDGHRWAMAIDLNVCNGCSACVIACQAENNIPVVGKSEVARGREMHWLRIDRYFSDKPLHYMWKKDQEQDELPKVPVRVVHQPMPCQQCENAPCESVCPVAATVHSDEGLNDMVYNRCIGTRYCSNNCPYKVRRFNYFYNHHGPFHPRSEPLDNPELPKPPKSVLTKKLPHAAEVSKLEQMVFNPDVTVRSRGVMEKCTYCVQRIKQHTIPNRNEKFAELGKLNTELKEAIKAHGKDSAEAEALRQDIVELKRIEDGKIQTACQQSCPTQAIVFGDLMDPESRVSKLQAGDRAYGILTGLNTRPRTQYLAKLRNPSIQA